MNLTPEQVQHMVDTMTPEQIKSWVQQQAFEAWKAAGMRGTIEAATGVGKSVIGLLAAHAEYQVDPDALIYLGVPTETLRDDDWPAEMRKFGFDYMIPKIKRVCYKSLGDTVPERDVALFIGDEIHRFTVINTSFFSDERWKVFRIIGLTATLPTEHGGDSDADKRVLIDGLAPSCFQVSLEEAIALKLVSEFEVTVMLFDLDKTDAYIGAGTVKKPFKQTEDARYKYLTKQLGRAMYSGSEGFKFKCIQERTDFLYNLRSKEYLAREVMEYILPGNRTLIFCGSIDQSRKLCGENVYNSQTDDYQLALFCDEKIDYLGVVQALNEPLFSINLSNCWNPLRA